MADSGFKDKDPDHDTTGSPGRDENSGLRNTTPWNTVQGRVISLVSLKGGVGKTTSAVNLGAALALSGQTVLVVGLDPQCGVCRSLGSRPEDLGTDLVDLFEMQTALTDLAQPSSLKDLFYVSPQVLTLDDEERFLQGLEFQTDQFVAEIDRARNLYDTILIDCPPSLGVATRTALLASDSFLVPIQAEELSRESVESLLGFVETYRARNFHPDVPELEDDTSLELEGMFLTMASTRTKMGRHVSARVAEDYGDLVFQSEIPRTTRLSEMALRGKPTVIYDRRSAGSRAYFDLADELVERFLMSQEAETDAHQDFSDDRPIQSSHDMDADPVSANPAGDEQVPGPVMEAGPEHGALSPGGLERFLAELGSKSAPAHPKAEDSQPEMVSLDDLLAEEEDRSPKSEDDEDWDEGFWSTGTGPDRRLN